MTLGASSPRSADEHAGQVGNIAQRSGVCMQGLAAGVWQRAVGADTQWSHQRTARLRNTISNIQAA
jgi:hypothetical protein